MTLCIEVTVQKEKEGKTSERGLPSYIKGARQICERILNLEK